MQGVQSPALEILPNVKVLLTLSPGGSGQPNDSSQLPPTIYERSVEVRIRAELRETGALLVGVNSCDLIWTPF